jgi:hypothetical protein
MKALKLVEKRLEKKDREKRLTWAHNDICSEFYL